MLFILVTECHLDSIVPVGVWCFYLGHHTGTSFNDGAGGLLAIRTEDAGHPDFFSNNSFHCCSVCAFVVEETFAVIMVELIPSKRPAWRQEAQP